MKVRCIFCGHELNLEHRVFDDYEGALKCFACSCLMEVKTAQGYVYSISPLAILEDKAKPVLFKARD